MENKSPPLTWLTCLMCLLVGGWAGYKLRGDDPPSPVQTTAAVEAKEEKQVETVVKEIIRYETKKGPVVKETITETKLVEKKTGVARQETKPVRALPLPRYIAGGNYSWNKETNVFIGGRIGNLPVFLTGGLHVDQKHQLLSPTIGVIINF